MPNRQAFCPADDVVHDPLELRREAVLVVDALEREDCAGDARELGGMMRGWVVRG